MKAKKLIGLLMAIIMCLGVVAPLSVSAADKPLTVIYEEDFEELSGVSYAGDNASIAAAKGWYADKAKLYDSNGNCIFTIGNALDGSNNKTFNYSTKQTKDTAKFDFRLPAGTDLAYSFNQDFVVSFKLYPTASSWTFRPYIRNLAQSGTAFEKTAFELNSGKVKLNGKETSATVPANKWTTIELVYHYDEAENVINSFSARINGAPIYYTENNQNVYEVSIKPNSNIDAWRTEVTTSAFFSIDDWKITLSDRSPYYYDQYSSKADGYQWFFNDYDGDQLPVDANTNNLHRVHDQYLPGNNNGSSTIANGILRLDNTGGTKDGNPSAGGFYDIRPYADTTDGAVKFYVGDMTISFKIKPDEDFVSGNGFMQIRQTKESGHSAVNVDVIKYEDGKLICSSANAEKYLSNTEFSTVELMFTYDWDRELYTNIDVYANGSKMASVDISNKGLHCVNHIRAFWGHQINSAIDLDFFSIAKGHRSLHAVDPLYVPKTKFVGYQTTAVNNDLFNLRLVAVIKDKDLSQYEKVGFKIKASYDSVVLNNTQDVYTVYNKIVAGADGPVVEYTAEQLGGDYIFALICKNVPANKGPISFEVTTYYKLEGQNTVEESTVSFTVDPTRK